MFAGTSSIYRMTCLGRGFPRYALFGLPIVFSCGGGPEKVANMTTAVTDTIEECSALPRLEAGPFEMVPESLVAFGHTTATCDALGAGFLLRNSSARPVQVTGLGVLPETFHLGSMGVPTTIEPGETLRAELSYDSTVASDEVSGSLRVMTPEGCMEFEVLGLAVDGGLVTYSERAIDFGAVPPAGTSASVTVEVMYQQGSADAHPEFSGFSATPPELFEVVGDLESPLRPASCEPFRIDVRLEAPTEPGPVQGALLWRQQTDTPQGIAEATAFIELFGRVR